MGIAIPKAVNRVVPVPAGAKPLYLCVRCLGAFPADAFRKAKRASTGLFSWCKACSREYNLSTRPPKIRLEAAVGVSGEQWLPVPGYEGLYEVSDLGRIRSLPKVAPHPTAGTRIMGARIMKPGRAGRGYPHVALMRDRVLTGFYVHRLVLLAFRGPPPFEGAVARHLDGSLDNNRLENLMWGSAKENAADKYVHGTHRAGTESDRASLTRETLVKVRARLEAGERQVAIARAVGVNPWVISFVAQGRTYRNEP